ncbi:MAG: hypothetical protein IKC19_04470 [Bacteroidales bacterium]|nr:hypothetical protein [Bacteroidales bacterium]
MNNTAKYDDLRQRYPLFEYVDYHYRWDDGGLHLRFDFSMGGVEFHPEALVEARPFLDRNVAPGVLDHLVFDIGMIELISYWKCACPPTVKVSCGSLTDEQTAFWRKLYWNGLGEFFYTNGIAETPDAFMRVESGKRKVESKGIFEIRNPKSEIQNSYLVPIGGGKDSVVTLELLRRAGKTIRPLIMNPRGATVECARVGGFGMDEVLVIRRTIDPVLLELNAKGYLNGHTPFSAMLAFYTRLASALTGIPNVALSNESSANESTVRGTSVNHQYSKSLEFEDDFRDYCANELMCNCAGVDASATDAITHSHIDAFNYFSFLRPLSELQIAMLFSRFTAYHDVFRSCNAGSKQDIWCGHCAKCLFAYIILSPFVEPDRLNAIFGKSMLDDTTLEHEFRQLLGEAETKPSECVGTVGEVHQALRMTVERWSKEKRPKLLESVQLDKPEQLIKLDRLAPIGNLSEEERQILQQACTEKTN